MYREHLYDPADVRRILKRAADLQERAGAAPVESNRLTLAEIQALAAAAGIHADAVASAAAPDGADGKVAARPSYLETSLFRIVSRRVPWLVLLFAWERLAGRALRVFDEDLMKVAALAFYVPLVLGVGAQAASQTSSTVIRALALGDLRFRDVLRVAFKEACAGLVLGIVLGGIALRLSLRAGDRPDLAACVAVATMVICVGATFVSGVVPIAMHRMRVDPAAGSGPILIGMIDVLGVIVLFAFARLMLAQLHGG
jgi:magnesium transporter